MLTHHERDSVSRVVSDSPSHALQPWLKRAAITWVNHAGAPLVKVVPRRHLHKAADLGVGFSPVADAFRVDGCIAPRHRLPDLMKICVSMLLWRRWHLLSLMADGPGLPGSDVGVMDGSTRPTSAVFAGCNRTVCNRKG